MGGDGPHRDYAGPELAGFFIGAFLWMVVAALGISCRAEIRVKGE